MSRRQFAVALGTVTLAALFWRVAYVLVEHRDSGIFGDAWAYHRGANLLADGHGFIDAFRYDLTGLEKPSAAHPPLYTLYLAVWSLLGIDTPLGHRLVSTLLGAAAVLVVGLVARRLAGERAGIAAAIFAAVYPHLWLNDAALLSESAAALAVAVSLLAIERYRDRPDLAPAAQLGGAFALATLTRAELVLLFPLVALPLLIACGTHDARARLERLGTAALVAVVLVGPWVAHNLTRFEEPVTLSNGLGATMLGGSCDPAWSGEKLGYWSELCPTVEVGDGPDEATLARWRADPEGTRDEVTAYLTEYARTEPDESERDVASRELALAYVDDHTGRLPVVVAARVGRIWNVYRPAQNVRFDADIEGRGSTASWAALLGYYALVGMAAVALARLHRAGRPIWPYLVLVGIVTFSTAITFGVQRYRLPVDVALCVVAGTLFGVPRILGGAPSSRNEVDA